MTFRVRNLLIPGAVGAVLVLAAVPFASAEDTATQAVTPPYAVEDFNYPGAQKVLETKGILLKRGDGHIVLADCDYNRDQIRVLTVKDASVNRDELYCFEASGTSGWLTLELERVFALETESHPISADLVGTTSGTTVKVDVAKNGYKSVGEGTVGGERSVLVELRVTG
ncbi:hypothetical protein [Streptomyces sp. TRM72054]|uniref:hypothetical protein n=1 Tax=Streptomyces sp. TRM72054 TaxID=2870562 RepID=UPI0021AB33BD|nr:hypothetical protein [Streptomyces sp. TRM72054]